jgi:hypothetical protein
MQGTIRNDIDAPVLSFVCSLRNKASCLAVETDAIYTTPHQMSSQYIEETMKFNCILTKSLNSSA